MTIFIQILLLVVGFAILVLGADWFVDGASGIARKARIPEIIIGLTIVAFGTSAPEAAVSITGALTDAAGITVGNIWGSNILNILLILGLAALIRPLGIEKASLWIEIPFLILCSVAFLLMGAFDSVLQRYDGAILLVMFLAFLTYTIMMAKRNRTPLLETTAAAAINAEADRVSAAKKNVSADTLAVQKNGSTVNEMVVPVNGWNKMKLGWSHLKTKLWVMIVLTIAGLGLVIGGSMLAVDAAKNLASMAGVSDALIGLTVVALGTSLPELVTSVVATIKGKMGIAIGNIIGSNIFNILFVGGLSAIIMPITYAPSFIFDGCIGIGAAALLFASVVWRKNLGRIGGGVMLVGFIAYWTVIILRSLGILVF